VLRGASGPSQTADDSSVTSGSRLPHRPHLPPIARGVQASDLADDRVFARSAHVGVVTLRVPDASPVRWIHVGDDMALVKRPDVNIRDNLNKFGNTCRAEGQVTQDLESIGLGVRGDTELGLSRASFTGLEPDPVPMQLAIHDPMLPQRGDARSCRTQRPRYWSTRRSAHMRASRR
jgi:hypothetical protein